jgi:hypothetical protein
LTLFLLAMLKPELSIKYLTHLDQYQLDPGKVIILNIKVSLIKWSIDAILPINFFELN